jgi:hypothetical protein
MASGLFNSFICGSSNPLAAQPIDVSWRGKIKSERAAEVRRLSQTKSQGTHNMV